jgi:putative acetyltransferase
MIRFGQGWERNMSGRVVVRPETEADWPAIDAVNRQAFGGEAEAALVRRLRQDRLVAASLVAEENGTLAGHLMLSWLPTIVEGRPVRAVALAPMAVRPDWQRRMIGSRLVEAGIAVARQLGVEAMIVLGHPAYYPRFGFSAALASGLASPFARESFMALELAPNSISGKTGSVHYPPAFGIETYTQP